MTQERSKVLKETENPFGIDEEDEPPASTSQSPTAPTHRSSGSVSQISQIQSFSHLGKKESDKKKKEKKGKKQKTFNLEAEREEMKANIAEASMAATNLTNTLQSINRETERISENQLAVQRFEACKQLRRKILRYVSHPAQTMRVADAHLYQIHHVESEQWLGSLLHANDELVTALMTFEQLDRSIDADSDSDDDIAEQAHLYRSMKSSFSPNF